MKPYAPSLRSFDAASVPNGRGEAPHAARPPAMAAQLSRDPLGRAALWRIGHHARSKLLMTDPASLQASLELTLKDEIVDPSILVAEFSAKSLPAATRKSLWKILVPTGPCGFSASGAPSSGAP